MTYNITSIPGTVSPYRQQGAIIHSVTTPKEYTVYYGVQSATFVRTVFPGQASGTYKVNRQLPTWQGAQITAAPGTVGSYRSAGSPPIPYPPRNASAYYSSPPQRIVPNPGYKAYG